MASPLLDVPCFLTDPAVSVVCLSTAADAAKMNQSACACDGQRATSDWKKRRHHRKFGFDIFKEVFQFLKNFHSKTSEMSLK